MNKEEPIRDQAEKLRKRMKDVDLKVDSTQDGETAVSNEKLPPRSRVHKQKQLKKKTKIKVKYPLLRLLGMFFILLPIVIFSIYTYNDSQKSSVSTTVEESKGAEAVYYTDVEEEVAEEEKEKAESEEIAVDKNVEAESGTVEESAKAEQAKPSETAQETTTTPESTTNSTTKAEPVDQTVVYHKVQPGETVFRLAMKYYKSQSGIDIIKKANSLSSNEITVGQTLTIPLSK
ncbi:LysM peptidoglycan-binding domain-containing protein [Robertmurraya korlensis]|uniref:LysM peptidoglycan-binding domain-containing protein n=1 Tax=Robertmurraya korlensis TaxID=519977 RepID=UPI00203F579B|nr:LysM peptidoglycan-binding domain-containing protein [Robertmurraya korlensis]MCM3599745.1 LysM peptidoglycan-binding domain-containing protein [Robertmurraya korlensis]